jgi:hypothetical protein
VGKVVMYASVSVDGFIADESDQPGPLFDWLSSGDVPLDESGEVKVSQTSYDYTRPYWDQIGVTVVGRHVFTWRTASSPSNRRPTSLSIRLEQVGRAITDQLIGEGHAVVPNVVHVGLHPGNTR